MAERTYTEEDMRIYAMSRSIDTFITMKHLKEGDNYSLVIDSLSALVSMYTKGQIIFVIQQDEAGNYEISVKPKENVNDQPSQIH